MHVFFFQNFRSLKSLKQFKNENKKLLTYFNILLRSKPLAGADGAPMDEPVGSLGAVTHKQHRRSSALEDDTVGFRHHEGSGEPRDAF